MMERKSIPAIVMILILLPAFSQAKESRIKKVGKSPNFIQLSPAGDRIYATSFGTDELIGIDLSKGIVDQKIYVGASPLGFALFERGKKALVACKEQHAVAVVDLENSNVIGNINVGDGYPNFVAIDPRGYRAYVTDYGRTKFGKLYILDVRDQSVIGTVEMGTAPFTCVVSPVTDLVYVIVGGDNEVWVVNPDEKKVVGKIKVGEVPDGIAISPDGKNVYVANSRSNDLSIIDTRNARVLVTIPVGKMPFGVAVTPDGKRVFVVNNGSRNVSVIPADLSSLEPEMITFKVEKGPTNIVIGSDNRTVYVVNELSNSIVIKDVPDEGGK